MSTETKSLLDGLVSQRQACEEMNCSKMFLWRLRNQVDGLATVKIGHHLYYRRADLQGLIDRKLAAARTNPSRKT